MANRGYVYLGARGQAGFDVDVFTAAVGLRPITAWNIGQRDPQRGLPRQTIWD